MENHMLSFKLSLEETGFFPVYAEDKFSITICFADNLTAVNELSVCLFNSLYHFVGSDVFQVKSRKLARRCSFDVCIPDAWCSETYLVYVHVNGRPKWFARVVFDGEYDKWYRTSLELLADIPQEDFFINRIFHQDWWQAYDGLGLRNCTFTMLFMNRVQLFLMHGIHSVWSSFPAAFVVGKYHYEPRYFAVKVLSRLVAEEKDSCQLKFADFSDSNLDWDQLLERVQAAKVVTVDLSFQERYAQGSRKLRELAELIRNKVFVDIPFIFYGTIEDIARLQRDCLPYKELQRTENTFYLPNVQSRLFNGSSLSDYTHVNSDDSDDYDRKLESFVSQQVIEEEETEECSSEESASDSDSCQSQTEEQVAVEAIEGELSADKQLQQMIGLTGVKREIVDARLLAGFMKERQNLGLEKEVENRNHMLFLGNPGTGKTTVAKLIGEMYHEMGLLSKGHTVVTDRSHLIGNYIGEAEKNTTEAIEEARGGVLFVDEAYTLFTSKENVRDYGPHVLETLLTVLSEPNPDLIVIFAGYEDKIQRLLEFNQGLLDRFPVKLHFEDYSSDELLQIARNLLTERNFMLTEAAEVKLASLIDRVVENREETFGNARWVHNLVEQVLIKNVARRVMSMSVRTNYETLYKLVHECDVLEAEKVLFANQPLKIKQPRRIGFTA